MKPMITPVRLLASTATALLLGIGPSFAQQTEQFQQPSQLNQSGTQNQGQFGQQQSQMQGTPGSQTQGNLQIQSSPQAFLANAVSLDKFEIAAAAIATDILQNEEDLRSFPETMIIEHGTNAQQLKGVALVNGLDAPPYLQQQQLQWLATLNNPSLSSREFAQQYFNIMIRSHEIGARVYEQEAQNGQNPDLKQFASLKLPALQDHLQDARNIAQNLGVASIAEPGQQYNSEDQYDEDEE